MKKKITLQAQYVRIKQNKPVGLIQLPNIQVKLIVWWENPNFMSLQVMEDYFIRIWVTTR